MSRPEYISKKRSELSPEKIALLEKRLQGALAVTNLGKVTVPSSESDDAVVASSERRVSESSPGVAIDLEVWESMVRAGQEQSRVESLDPELQAEAAREEHIDRLSAAYVCLAFKELGVYGRKGESYTADELIERCRILPRYHKVLHRWLAMLIEEGLVFQNGGFFTNLFPLPTESLDALLSEDERRSQGEKLSALLTGKRHPLEYLIPDGSSHAIERDYVELPIFRYCNGICKRVLGTLIESLPPNRPLRILEIGAGTGGTTASVLPLLPPDRTAYVYTDISKFFIALGREKFRDYPFIQYGRLDVESNPRDQGYRTHSFEMVVAAHVLHATRSIKETVQHVRSLLAPEGILLLLEEIRFRRLFNFGMGFMPGFDRFEDYDVRQGHPLLSSERWRELLLAHGFQSVATFTEPGSPAHTLGVDVILARATGV